MALCSLRSHFFKHLPCTTPFFFPVRHLHRHFPPRTSIPTPFTSLSSLFTKTLIQGGLNSISITKFLTKALSDITATSSFAAPYLSVDIMCRKDVADMFSEALLCFGASSTSIDEQDNHENDEVCISSIFADCQDVDECISYAANSIGLNERPSYKVIKGDQFDWIKKAQESFNPVEITQGLWVVPEWSTPRYDSIYFVFLMSDDLQATNIILNPGLAFGTGEHPTTKLCLLLLHNSVKGGELFLDYGTGSGILAIAAIKLGAALSVGLDIDPQAITSAQQNASLNNIQADKLQLHLVLSKTCPTIDEGTHGGEERQNSSVNGVTETEKYDVVIANILLNPLLDLADHIVSYAKPRAVVGISGIISEQIPNIVARYSQLLEGISVSELDGWACVSGTKKTNAIAC